MADHKLSFWIITAAFYDLVGREMLKTKGGECFPALGSDYDLKMPLRRCVALYEDVMATTAMPQLYPL